MVGVAGDFDQLVCPRVIEEGAGVGAVLRAGAATMRVSLEWADMRSSGCRRRRPKDKFPCRREPVPRRMKVIGASPVLAGTHWARRATPAPSGSRSGGCSPAAPCGRARQVLEEPAGTVGKWMNADSHNLRSSPPLNGCRRVVRELQAQVGAGVLPLMRLRAGCSCNAPRSASRPQAVHVAQPLKWVS